MALEIRRPIQVCGCEQQNGKTMIADFNQYEDIDNAVFVKLGKKDLNTRLLLGGYEGFARTSPQTATVIEKILRVTDGVINAEIDKIGNQAVVDNKVARRSVRTRKQRVFKFGALLPEKMVITMPEVDGLQGIQMTVLTAKVDHSSVYINLTIEVVEYLQKLFQHTQLSSSRKKIKTNDGVENRNEDDVDEGDVVVEEDVL
jgi:hypothetical protein